MPGANAQCQYQYYDQAAVINAVINMYATLLLLLLITALLKFQLVLPNLQ